MGGTILYKRRDFCKNPNPAFDEGNWQWANAKFTKLKKGKNFKSKLSQEILFQKKLSGKRQDPLANGKERSDALDALDKKNILIMLWGRYFKKPFKKPYKKKISKKQKILNKYLKARQG